MCPAVLVLLLVVDGGAVPRPAWLPAPPPPSAAPAEATYVLKRDGDGFLYADGRFKVRIARDGSVKFEDRLAFRPGFLLPLPTPVPEGTPTLERSVRRYLGDRRKPPPRPPQPYVPMQPTANEVCDYRDACFMDPVGPTSFERPADVVGQLATLVRVGGSLDLTDAVLRAFTSDDPYRYEKARFLSATFDFRARLAAREQGRRASAALDTLPAQLETIWRDTRFTPLERRRILCGLWGELDAKDPGGEKAAAEIARFVRTRLPEGSATGYSRAELDGCTAVTGRPFDPYR